MEIRATPLVRVLRAGLLAAVVTAAGSIAHASGGGEMPGWASLLALYVALTAACAAVLGREATARWLVALTVGGQVVVHGALAGLAGHASASSTAPSMAHGPHGGMVHPASPGAAPGWLTHGVEDAVAHPAMAALHLLAAAAVGLWLAVGERALWTLVRLARCTARDSLGRAVEALGLLPVVLRRVPRAVGVRAVAVDPLPLLPVWSRGPARRGPPPVLLPH